MTRLVVAGLFLMGLSVPAWSDSEITGTAFVVDGDTLVIAEQQIRLFGIDAPQLNQVCRADGGFWSCGIVAASYLRNLVAGSTVVCRERGRDDDGRILAVCTVNKGDLAAAMVRGGMASAYLAQSEKYVEVETSAKVARLGIWKGKFIPPWEWREGPVLIE
ncbi:MAG: thermonuclease family protein [Alphaproteobacteria bacterium]